jgi:hypothetical protein
MTKITPSKIKVKAIQVDPIYGVTERAWRISRPDAAAIDIEEIYKIDAPINELSGFVFHLHVPILLREIIVSARDHVIWARTSRVDNLTAEWPVYEGITSSELLKVIELADKMKGAVREGKKQDDYRMFLPISYMTDFTARFSVRSLRRLLAFLDTLEAPEMSRMATDFRNAVLAELGIASKYQIMESYAKHEPFLEAFEPVTHYQSRVGNILSVTRNMPLALRAQLARHRQLNIADELLELLNEKGVWGVPIGEKMSVTASGSEAVWRQIVRERNCWLAQGGLWADIVDTINTLLDDSKLSLPCENGICPYSADCLQRHNGNDPGAPCPRWYNLEKKAAPAHMLPEMRSYMEKTRPQPQWRFEMNQLEKN